MQRIERYGVIALVFLLVTILAVAVWGQRKNQSLLSFLKRDKSAEIAKAEPPAVPPPSTSLTLSDPSHEVQPAAQPLPPASGALDPTTVLLPAPAGPGPEAVTFDHGPAVQPGSGFVGTDGAGAPPLGTAAPAPDAGARTYKVKPGDTLGSIAQRELGSTKRWKEIEALNGVKPERLLVGMVLKLPAGSSATAPQTLVKSDAASAKARALQTPDAPRTYSVRSGDSLSKIAAAQLGDASRYGEILLLNPGVDPSRLSIGQTLRLPADAKAQVIDSKPKPKPVVRDAPQLARADTTPKKAKVQ